MNPDQPACPGADRTILLLANELAPAEVPSAEEHVRTCRSCHRFQAELTAVESAYARGRRPALSTREFETMVGRAAAAAEIAGGRRPSAWRLPAPMATAAAVTLFALGLFTGIRLARPGVDAEIPGATYAGAPTGLRSPSPVHRVRTVLDLAQSGLTQPVASELVSLLETEPNPNVRLGIIDALGMRGSMTREDRSGVLGLLATEPVPALRIELLQLALRQGAPAVESALERAADQDEAASVRSFAATTLARLRRSQ